MEKLKSWCLLRIFKYRTGYATFHKIKDTFFNKWATRHIYNFQEMNSLWWGKYCKVECLQPNDKFHYLC